MATATSVFITYALLLGPSRTRIATGAVFGRCHQLAEQDERIRVPLICSSTARVRAILVPTLRPFGLPLSPGFQTIVIGNLLQGTKRHKDRSRRPRAR